MTERLEVRRGPTRRETTVYLVAALGALGTVAIGFLLVRVVMDSWPAESAVAGIVSISLPLLVLSGLLLGVVVTSLVSWQLVLRPGSPDDVVLRFDDEGLSMFDAGSRVFASWYSVSSLTTEPLPNGYRMRVVTHGPVTGSRDRLSRLIIRAMGRQGMTYRFSPEDPNHATLSAAVERLSGGAFRLAPLSGDPA